MACCHGDASHTLGEELLRAIDAGGVSCLNEAVAGSAAGVLKAHCSRADKGRWLDSAGGGGEGGGDLLLSIPFSSTVQLRALCVSAAPGAAPARARLWANAPDLDFAAAEERAPAADVALGGPDEAADVWHALRAAKFNNLSSLQILLVGGGGAGATRVFFVGLRADVVGGRRGVVHATYESQAQRADHAAGDALAAGGAAPRT